MKKPTPTRALEMLGGVVFAQGLVDDLNRRLDVARLELVRRAHREGDTQSAIAAVLGVSQQRVGRMLDAG